MDFHGLAWNVAHVSTNISTSKSCRRFLIVFSFLRYVNFFKRATIKHISRLWRYIYSQRKKISKIADTIFERNMPSVQKCYRCGCTLNLSGFGTRLYEATIGDKSVEKIVENRTTSRKSVVRLKFQAPSSPIQCWTKRSSHEQHCMGDGGVADGFYSLFTDI